MKTVLLSIPKSLNSTIEFIRNLVQVILELLLREMCILIFKCFFALRKGTERAAHYLKSTLFLFLTHNLHGKQQSFFKIQSRKL